MNFNPAHQIRWIWSLTRGHRPQLAAYFVLELFAIVLSLLFVLWSKRAVDIATRSSADDLRTVLTLVSASALLALLIRSFSGWLNERTRLRIGLQLQRRLADAQMMSVWKAVKDRHSGDIQVRIHADSNEVVGMVGYSAISFALTLIRLLASFGFLWSMDPMLAFMVLGMLPLLLFSKLYFRKMRRLSRLVKQEESRFGAVLQENMRFRLLIRAMDLLSGRGAKLEQSQHLIYSLKKEQLTFSAFTQGAMKIAMNLGYLLAFVWGIYRLHAGQISFGTMTAFLQLVGRIQAPFLTLIGFAPLFIRFRTSLERLMELVAEDSEQFVEPQKIRGLKALSVEDLAFGYAEHQVIHRLTMKVQAARPTAIVGASGKGKTTLIRLMLALLRPDSGGIWLEDNSRKYGLTAAHRANFAYVPQGNSLFSGTVRENLLVAGAKADEDRIRHALWLACAEFVYHLPDGIDTVVGESGHGLSEGQAQRIAIARAMMRDCDIWLFDEVTAALDRETAGCLIKRLLQEGENKICLFMTHDLRLARNCKQTIYMN